MKKLIFNTYGDESVLQPAEYPLPAISDSQLLIKVKSASINPMDWKIYKGEMKLMAGSKFPKSIGIDFSGVVEKIGSGITQFKAGDEVFGLLDVFKGGALAEYVVVAEKDIAVKPYNISFPQAAALPATGLSALQIVQGLAAMVPGQEVLINGAAGGVGMFAIQLAKMRGAIVTAVTGSKGLAAAAKWGADAVLDYKKQKPDAGRQFDVVIDLSGKMSFGSAKKNMKAHSLFISTIPTPAAMLGAFINNLFSSRKYKILVLKPTKEGLLELSKLAGANLDVTIDKVYGFTNVRDAYREVSKNGVIGKAVINIQ